jgi:hypothetical protein
METTARPSASRFGHKQTSPSPVGASMPCASKVRASTQCTSPPGMWKVSQTA